MTSHIWHSDSEQVSATKLSDGDGDGELWSLASTARAAMMEALIEADDDLCEYVLELELEDDTGLYLDVPVDAVVSAIRRTTLSRALVPTVCGAALRGLGVEALLDAAVAFLPSPTDRAAPMIRTGGGTGGSGEAGEEQEEEELETGPDAPLCAYAFKVTNSRASEMPRAEPETPPTHIELPRNFISIQF